MCMKLKLAVLSKVCTYETSVKNVTEMKWSDASVFNHCFLNVVSGRDTDFVLYLIERFWFSNCDQYISMALLNTKRYAIMEVSSLDMKHSPGSLAGMTMDEVRCLATRLRISHWENGQRLKKDKLLHKILGSKELPRRHYLPYLLLKENGKLKNLKNVQFKWMKSMKRNNLKTIDQLQSICAG